MSKRPKTGRGGTPANAPRNQKRRGGAHSGGKSHKGSAPAGNRIFLFGIHSVEAALRNPQRHIVKLWATRNALERLKEPIRDRGLEPEDATPQEIDRLVGPDTVHQGVLLECSPLHLMQIEDMACQGLYLMLDQVTDPHNVGAILRSAAAFGVAGLIMTERNSPALSGVLGKTASGGLEHVPVALVTNLSRTLDKLGDAGFVRIGLDGEGEGVLDRSMSEGGRVLVLGAEGKGLRRLTKENCDRLCRIPTSGGLSSLNVSNAAAVALYALQNG